MFDRTDEDIAAGVIRLPLAGQDIILPTLSWEASEEWQGRFKEALHDITHRDFDNLDTAVALLGQTMGTIVEMVADYDQQHKLGRDAAALKQRYDRAQLYEVFKAIARHEFPFMRDAEGVLAMLLPALRPILLSLLAGVASRQPSTTSGPSPTGDSTPELSVVSSTSANSTSSGRQAKSA